MTRDSILLAAAQIFSEKGFHAASMQDIAEAVSLQKGSLYYHVSSKQEILVELLDQALDLLIARQEEVMSLPLPPAAKLRQAIVSYLTTLRDHRNLSAVLLFEYRSLEPQYRARHNPRRDHFERQWRDLIQEGIDAGIFSPVETAFASRALIGGLNWTITWYRPDGPLSAEEIANQYADFYLEGLRIRHE